MTLGLVLNHLGVLGITANSIKTAALAIFEQPVNEENRDGYTEEYKCNNPSMTFPPFRTRASGTATTSALAIRRAPCNVKLLRMFSG